MTLRLGETWLSPPGRPPSGPRAGGMAAPSLPAQWGHGESSTNLDLVVPGPVRDGSRVQLSPGSAAGLAGAAGEGN